MTVTKTSPSCRLTRFLFQCDDEFAAEKTNQLVHASTPMQSGIRSEAVRQNKASSELFIVHYRCLAKLQCPFIFCIGRREYSLRLSGALHVGNTVRRTVPATFWNDNQYFFVAIRQCPSHRSTDEKHDGSCLAPERGGNFTIVVLDHNVPLVRSRRTWRAASSEGGFTPVRTDSNLGAQVRSSIERARETLRPTREPGGGCMILTISPPQSASLSLSHSFALLSLFLAPRVRDLMFRFASSVSKDCQILRWNRRRFAHTRHGGAWVRGSSVIPSREPAIFLCVSQENLR